MSFFSYKQLFFSSLFTNFMFISYHFIEAQSVMEPPFNQALLPFGSQNNIGSFTRSCGIGHSDGSTITILNNCPYTIWAAIIDTSRSLGSGRRLDNGEAWTLNMLDNSVGRVWGRTSCSFDGLGRGFCETGDCGGVLNCKDFGTPPLTLAEFSLNRANNLDFLDISCRRV